MQWLINELQWLGDIMAKTRKVTIEEPVISKTKWEFTLTLGGTVECNTVKEAQAFVEELITLWPEAVAVDDKLISVREKRCYCDGDCRC